MLLLKLVEPADAGPDNRARPVRIFLAKIEAAVLDRADRCHQGKLGEAVQMAGDLGIQHCLGIEVLDLASKMHLEGRGVELLDQADAVPAGAERLPELLDIGRE